MASVIINKTFNIIVSNYQLVDVYICVLIYFVHVGCMPCVNFDDVNMAQCLPCPGGIVKMCHKYRFGFKFGKIYINKLNCGTYLGIGFFDIFDSVAPKP